MSNNEFIKTISYLSFDFTETFFEDIGLLPMVNASAFRLQLRQIITDAYSNKIELNEASSLYIYTIKKLQITLRKEDFNTFQYWLEHIYYYVHADKPHLSAWNIIINRILWNKNFMENSLKMYPKGIEIQERFKKHVGSNIQKGTEKYKELSHQMLSLWDTEIFAVNNLCFDFDDDDLRGFIEQSIASTSIIKLSKEFNLKLDKISTEWLNKIGQYTITEYGVWMPETLINFEKLYLYDYK